MVFSHHDLWSHVARSSWRVIPIILLPFSRDSEITQSHVSVHPDQKVFRLDVSVKYSHFMNIFKSSHCSSNNELKLLFIKLCPLFQIVPHIASIDQVGDYIHPFSILKSIIHVNHKRMLNLRKYVSFIHNRLNTFLLNDLNLLHLFQRIHLPIWLCHNLIHLSKASPSNFMFDVEMLMNDLWS